MKKSVLLFTIAVFALASCTKEVTKVVPGEEGGAQGIVYTIQPKDWVYEKNNGAVDSTVLYADFEVPELTNAIFDHGAVLVYLSFADGEYEALPEVINFYSYSARHYDDGWVTVAKRDIDGYSVLRPAGEIWVKIVLINAQKLQMHPNVDLKDYSEVKQVFHLRD